MTRYDPRRHHHRSIRHNPVGATFRRRPNGQAPGQARGPAPTAALSLSDVVHRLKSFTSAPYRQGVTQAGWPPFPGRLRQRSYCEHIVCAPESLQRIRAYIETNPERWALDRGNPARSGENDIELSTYSSCSRVEVQS